MKCALCHKPVDSSLRSTYVRVQGWERRAISASRKSGSDIVMRERLQEFAHPHCIELTRSGVPISQESLL